MAHRRPGKSMHRSDSGPRAGADGLNLPDETDLAQDIQGRNKLQGDDQSHVRNERHAVPDERKETESVVESFEHLDPRKRARRR